MIDKALKTKVHTLLQDTVTLLLRNSIPYKLKINVEALIGVTIDEDDVVLININKSYEKDKPKTETKVDRSPKPSPKHQLKTPDRHHEIDAKKRKRSAGPHNSNDVSSMQQYYSDLAGSAKRKTNYKELGYVIKTEAPEEVLVSKSGKKGKNYNRFDSPIGYQPTPGDDLQVTGVSFAQNSGSPSNRVSFAPNKQLPTPVQIIPHGKMPTGKAGSPFKSPKNRFRFRCQYCNKNLKTKTGLNLHENNHRGEKRFHCEKCSKGFQVRSHLLYHQRRGCGLDGDIGSPGPGSVGTPTANVDKPGNESLDINDFPVDGAQNKDSFDESLDLTGITVVQPEAPPEDNDEGEDHLLAPLDNEVAFPVEWNSGNVTVTLNDQTGNSNTNTDEDTGDNHATDDDGGHVKEGANEDVGGANEDVGVANEEVDGDNNANEGDMDTGSQSEDIPAADPVESTE